MATDLSIDETRLMLCHVASVLVANENYLTEIDEKVGDGDHGIGIATGFSAVKKMLSHKEFTSVEAVFQAVGNTLLDTMGGASGVLFGTLFISGTIGQATHQRLTSRGLAELLGKSLRALKSRGKASLGDKTLIDALEPAVIILEEMNQETLSKSVRAAALQAEQGVEKTKKMTAKFGRAKYYGDQVIGYQDPGATSISLIFASMAEWLENNVM